MGCHHTCTFVIHEIVKVIQEILQNNFKYTLEIHEKIAPKFAKIELKMAEIFL